MASLTMGRGHARVGNSAGEDRDAAAGIYKQRAYGDPDLVEGKDDCDVEFHTLLFDASG